MADGQFEFKGAGQLMMLRWQWSIVIENGNQPSTALLNVKACKMFYRTEVELIVFNR